MPLDQLLSVVVLSPAQASLLAVRVLDAVRIILSGNGTHPADTHRWTVALGLSGEVDVGDAPAGEGARTTELLEQLTHNARRLPAHPRPEQVELLHLLEEVAADPRPEPGPRARQLEGALAEVLGPGAGQRLSGQLAALVGAFAHIAPSVSVPLTPRADLGGARPDPRRVPPGPPPPTPPPRRRPVVGRRRARTRRTTLVLLFLAAALAGSAYVVLRDPDSGGTGASARDDRPTTTAPSGSSGKPAEKPRPRPRQDVGALAGRQAGQVTGVEVQKVGSCTPGSPCPVTVTVHLRPAATTQSVSWRVGAARLCRSGITWSQPVAMTAQPGWTTVYASSSVAVPPGRSLALVALTTAPARAQSPPVPLTGSSLGC
ncbi:hypothetical protein ASG94_20080 [Nocardioides sp. Soil805]|nr:hypothetical protein ASG94_20080 [Nocardioides sp. Soil805]